MRLLLFILAFVGFGVHAQGAATWSFGDCADIANGKYTMIDFTDCTSLVAKDTVIITLSGATQKDIDQFLEGKTFFKNIELSCDSNCHFAHFRMENISSEKLSINFRQTNVATIFMASRPEATIGLHRFILNGNDHLKSVRIGSISNANESYFIVTDNKLLNNISVSFGENESFDQLYVVNIHGNKLLTEEFLNGLNYKGKSENYWRIQTEGECSGLDFQHNLTLLPKCPYIHGDLKIKNDTSLENFNVSGLHIKKIYEGCYNINASRIGSVAFLVGTENEDFCRNCHHCVNVIVNNEFVCDYMDVVDNFSYGLNSLITRNNCHRCRTNYEPQANFSMLEQCEQVVVGYLRFAKTVAPMTKSIVLRRIDGCYHIENTDLTTVSFLIGTRTNDGCTNTIKNNRFLCDYMNVIDSYHSKNPELEIDENCKECQTYSKPQHDFLKLTHCEKLVVGELSFAQNVAPMPRWINLERIDGCYKIIDTDLTTVRFLIGTRTRSDCVNEIKNNKKLCDVQRVLDNIPQGTFIDAQNNCEKICYSSMELGKKPCEELYTDSAIPINFTRGLKRIHGAVKVTSLKTETVDPAIFKDLDYDEIVFRNNEFLCDEEAVRKLVPEGKKVTFKHNCWRRCSYPQIIHHRHCDVFEGILDFRLFKDVELFERVVQKITGIEGQLKVIGTFVRHLKFKNLKYVKFTGKGPAIVIKDNKYLEKLDVKNLTTVTGNEEPRVFIQNNGKFEFRRSVAKRLANQTGMRIGKSLKIDVRKAKITEGKCSKDDQLFKPINSSKGALYYCLVALMIFLSIITLIILFFICKLCVEVENDGGY